MHAAIDACEMLDVKEDSLHIVQQLYYIKKNPSVIQSYSYTIICHISIEVVKKFCKPIERRAGEIRAWVISSHSVGSKCDLYDLAR